MSIYDFEDHNHIPVSEMQMHIYHEYEWIDFKDKKYDDPKYDWKMVYAKNNDEKYGRMMISEKFKLRRGLTMGEFYGTGEVD